MTKTFKQSNDEVLDRMPEWFRILRRDFRDYRVSAGGEGVKDEQASSA